MAEIALGMTGHALPEGPVSLGPGDTLLLTLPGHFSAGYLWDVSGGEWLDVETLRDPPPPEGVPLADLPVGSGPDVRFRVTPRSPGRHVLAVRLRRPWEDAPRLSADIAVEARGD